MRYWEDGHFGWEVAGSQGEWSVPSIRQLSPRCLLMMISLEPGLHTHKRTHTQILCRLASGCLSTRLHRWLTGALMECVTAESGVCMSLGVCGVSWMHRRTEAWSTRWPPARRLPYELMVTQLIAEPATDLAVASSPCNPTAVLLVHDRVRVTQLASGEQRMLSRWVCVYVCAHAHSFCSLSEASHSKISVSVL